MINTSQKNTVLPALLALISAVLVAFTVITPALAAFRLDRELANNCANYNLTENVRKDITIDIEDGIVSVTPHDSANPKGNAAILLPLSKSARVADYKGCSAQAIRILVDVQKSHDEYISKACENFKAIVNGIKPLEEKNGEVAHMEGAVQFVKQYCQI